MPHRSLNNIAPKDVNETIAFYVAFQQIDQFVHRDALNLETSLYFKYLIGPLLVVGTSTHLSLVRYPNQLSNFESKESLSFRFFLFNIHNVRFQIHIYRYLNYRDNDLQISEL
jgi:hypothetical protein